MIIKPFQIRQQMMLFILSSTQWQTGEGSVLGMGSVFDFKGNASCREKLFTMKAILTGSYKFANVKKNVGKLSFFFFFKQPAFQEKLVADVKAWEETVSWMLQA